MILADACRWYAFRVESLDDREDRTSIVARVVDRGRLARLFRLQSRETCRRRSGNSGHTNRSSWIQARAFGEFDRLAVPVEKTGGHEERRAFEFLRQFVREELQHQSPVSG